jgi:signal transduction histidine kinase
MASPLKSFDIYNQNNVLKIIVALNLLLVGTGSVLFTNRLIAQLEQREENNVQLYAKALAYTFQKSDIDGDVTFVVNEITAVTDNIPVIYVNEHMEPVTPRNLDDMPTNLTPAERRQFLKAKVAEMRRSHAPIRVDLRDGEFGLIYFSTSNLLKQLRYLPFAQLLIISVLAVLAYLSFSSSRRAEQNRVWVGLAKETAHQLGTPMSSLMAWVEYMRAAPEQYEAEITDEIAKDVQRLETITGRFSSIGSIPTLKPEDLTAVVTEFVGYLARRISTKVKMSVTSELPDGQEVRINRLLFEWVIENVCKNAVDAMAGKGELNLTIRSLSGSNVAIDIRDTGKGMSKATIQKIFNPGFSTKKRGWGLGLTLAKRIVEEYHNGKLTVLRSEPGKGTTFRVLLRTAD